MSQNVGIFNERYTSFKPQTVQHILQNPYYSEHNTSSEGDQTDSVLSNTIVWKVHLGSYHTHWSSYTTVLISGGPYCSFSLLHYR